MAINIEKERQRLTELYAGMPSEQLEQIAQQSSDLTEIALAVLSTEMKRRGLAVPDSSTQVKTQSHTPELTSTTSSGSQAISNQQPSGLSPDRLAVVRRYRGLLEAHLGQASLDSAGIQCFLADDNMVRMDWFNSDAIGGVKLLVSEADFAEATDVLDQPMPESFEMDDMGEYKQPHCPQCGSLDVGLGVPLHIYGQSVGNQPPATSFHAWYCHQCKHTWDEPEEISAEE